MRYLVPCILCHLTGRLKARRIVALYATLRRQNKTGHNNAVFAVHDTSTITAELVNVHCFTFVDSPRQKISVDVRNVWIVEDYEFAVSQCSKHVVLIIPRQALDHRT